MTLKLCEQSNKTVTSHIMTKGPADVGSHFHPLRAMSISPVQNSMNSSRAASSLSDLDAHGSPHPERAASLAESTPCCSFRSTTLRTRRMHTCQPE